MKNICVRFSKKKSIIGMIHVQALPGTPGNTLSLKEIINIAINETKLYTSRGVDSIMIENMHDIPYLNGSVGPEITASMTAVACAIREITTLPLGIQILAGANREALAVAHVAGFDYIRAEGFVFAHVADEGVMNSCAGELLRYRKNIGAEEVAIFTDIKKKHSSHQVTADITLAETSKAAEFFISDGIIITGRSTGESALIDDVKEAKNSVKLPVIIGSGIDKDNIADYWDVADAFIIGSHFKKEGIWSNAVDGNRVEELMKQVEELRKR